MVPNRLKKVKEYGRRISQANPNAKNYVFDLIRRLPLKTTTGEQIDYSRSRFATRVTITRWFLQFQKIIKDVCNGDIPNIWCFDESGIQISSSNIRYITKPEYKVYKEVNENNCHATACCAYSINGQKMSLMKIIDGDVKTKPQNLGPITAGKKHLLQVQIAAGLTKYYSANGTISL